MADRPVMTAEDEIAAAKRVEDAEAAHWVAILSYPPNAPTILRALAEDVASDPELEVPEIEEAIAAVGRPEFEQLADAVARKVQLPDVGRAWVRRAREAALASTPGRGRTRADHDRYLARVRQTFRAQQRAKNDFVEANLRLTVAIVRRCDRTKMPLVDLIQEGNIGLMMAVEKFDHRRGYRFSTYAAWWIRHAVNRAIADRGRAVRIPVHMLETHNRVRRARHALLARHGVEPTVEELAVESGLPIEKVERAVACSIEMPYSLDRIADEEDGRTFVEMMEDESSPSPEDGIEEGRWVEHVHKMVGTLTPIEAAILRWRFGMAGKPELTLREVGDKYQLSRERIRQLEVQAIGKLRMRIRREEWV